jgi:uncharacterized damage-inducible protein DinB
MTATMNPCVVRYQRMLAYEGEANRRALDSLESVPEAARRSEAFDRAMLLMPHTQLARYVWLARLEGRPYEMPKDWFPIWTIEQTRLAEAEQDREWAEYFASLADCDLTQTISYTSSEGEQRVRVIDDVLIHVFNHSTYHRGQLARLVHECGGKRAVTDYIAVVAELG